MSKARSRGKRSPPPPKRFEVDRTRRRNQKFIDAGRLTVRQIDLATLRVPVKRLHKVFAFNVSTGAQGIRSFSRAAMAASREGNVLSQASTISQHDVPEFCRIEWPS